MTEGNVNGGAGEVAEPNDIESRANAEDSAAESFTDDLEQVVRAQAEGIVTHW